MRRITLVLVLLLGACTTEKTQDTWLDHVESTVAKDSTKP